MKSLMRSSQKWLENSSLKIKGGFGSFFNENGVKRMIFEMGMLK